MIRRVSVDETRVDPVPLVTRWRATKKRSVRIQCGRCGRVLARGVPTTFVMCIENDDHTMLVELRPAGIYLDIPAQGDAAPKGLRVQHPPIVVQDLDRHPGTFARYGPDNDAWPTSEMYRFHCVHCRIRPSMTAGALGAAFLREIVRHGRCDRLIIGHGEYASLHGGPVTNAGPVLKTKAPPIAMGGTSTT
jgi:hypothetical protein